MNDPFLRLRIVRIDIETADARSYWLEATNGQPVSYRPGQFLTLVLRHNGHEVRRSYSISSPLGQGLRLTIKRISNGEVSRWLLDTLRVGDELTSLPPAGRFTLDAASPGDLLLLGAGSGITPLLPLLSQALAGRPNGRITLLYSNTHERSVLFRDELEKLQQQHPDRFRLIHLLSNPSDDWTGRRGRLNNVMLEQLLPSLTDGTDRRALTCYVCGPPAYMRMAQFTLVVAGVPAEQIRRENFVVEPVMTVPQPAQAIDRSVTLQLPDRQVSIQVPAYKTILQAALDEGLHLPYSCRGGRCATCAARLVSGRVGMTINDVLTTRDLAEGWVLTCTGYPESDGVVIAL
ncbi:phenylacetate-CoA oxygenase/reductase subunit PaaK [Spirosoma luteolum]